MENDAKSQPEKAPESAKPITEKAEKVIRGERPKKSRGRRRGRGGQGGGQDNRPNRQGQANQKPKPSRSRKHKPKTPVDFVRESFFACGRCSFFFAGMRAKLTLETLTQMAYASNEGWLETYWSQDLCELVERTFGCEIHSDTQHFADSCLECGRKFIVSGNESGQLAYFDIQAERQAPHLPIDRVRKLPKRKPKTKIESAPEPEEATLTAENEPAATVTEPANPQATAAEPPQTK